jgi:hypothetical protein
VVCIGCPKGRGPGLPVSSRFLKLSTSKEALLVPRAGLPAGVRPSPLSFSCGSIDANVLENGLAGTPPGDVADCSGWYPPLVPAQPSDVVMSSPHPAVGVFVFPGYISVWGRSTGCAEREAFTWSLWSSRWTGGERGESSASSGCGGMKVVFDSMRTCFFVFGGASSSPVTRLLPIHS